ncbi:FMRFamide receptor [Lamellibrachia satsuma]|nr:FMRFamide receptor [Lamellibrachia satsuma]
MNVSAVPALMAGVANSTAVGTGRPDETETVNMLGERSNQCLAYDFFIEAVLMGALCLLGFAGNTLSMLCLWRDRSKSATPFLLVSLELADTLFLVAVLVLRVLPSVHTYTGQLGVLVSAFPYFGRYGWPCALTAETATIYLTILVTLNRYVAVCRPYETFKFCSLADAKRHVIIVCAFSVLYNLPRFFEYEFASVKDANTANLTTHGVVLSSLGVNRTYQIIYTNILYCLVFFLGPFVALVFLNSELIAALRETKRKRMKVLNMESSSSRSEDDITLMLIVVVVVFVVCQTPASTTQVLLSFLSDNLRGCPSTFFYYERISDLLVVVNSSINFIIYCFCSRRFRQILADLVCHRKEAPHDTIDKSEMSCRQYRPNRKDTNGVTRLSQV